jgi:signal transduction histidine kinase
VKFSPEGGRVWVETASEGGSLHVSVCDTGIGIAEEDLISIFDKFYQVKDSKTGGHEGTGLGLPITKHLVELHGGTISVKSQPGKGSRFELIFPLSHGLHT